MSELRNRMLRDMTVRGLAPRTYRIDVETGRQEKFCDFSGVLSRDGTQFAYRGPEGRLYLQPLDGGAPRVIGTLQKLAGSSPEIPIRWSLDGTAIYLSTTIDTLRGYAIDRLDLSTHRRTPWKRLRLDAFARAMGPGVVVAPEVDAYAYSYTQLQASDLFVVKGLR